MNDSETLEPKIIERGNKPSKSKNEFSMENLVYIDII